MSKVIIFGLEDIAQLAHFYLTHDSEHEVVAFTVSEEYMPDKPEFEGLPVVPFENVEEIYSPDEYALFAPISYRKMNRLRRDIYLAGKDKGYTYITYVSSKATVWPGTVIGENCFIFEDNTIQPFTSIGDNCILWSGNHIGHHGEIKDHVFFTSHVVLAGHCVVGDYSFLGVNATIRNGVTIADGTLIGMGALVVKDTHPWSMYTGSPAKKKERKSTKDFDLI